MSRRALVTGVGGQDGALLSALLLAEGYHVAGVVRRDPESYADNLGELLQAGSRRAEAVQQGESSPAIATGHQRFRPRHPQGVA